MLSSLCSSGILPFWNNSASDFGECTKKVLLPSIVALTILITGSIYITQVISNKRQVTHHYNRVDAARATIKYAKIVICLMIIFTGVSQSTISVDDVYFLCAAIFNSVCLLRLLHMEVRNICIHSKQYFRNFVTISLIQFSNILSRFATLSSLLAQSPRIRSKLKNVLT